MEKYDLGVLVLEFLLICEICLALKLKSRHSA